MQGKPVTDARPVARSVHVSSAIYSLETIKKAAYRFLDRFSIEPNLADGGVECKLRLASGITEEQADRILAEFNTELLDQDLRSKIAAETAPIRNAILALAFAPIRRSESE